MYCFQRQEIYYYLSISVCVVLLTCAILCQFSPLTSNCTFLFKLDLMRRAVRCGTCRCRLLTWMSPSPNVSTLLNKVEKGAPSGWIEISQPAVVFKNITQTGIQSRLHLQFHQTIIELPIRRTPYCKFLSYKPFASSAVWPLGGYQ